MKTNTYQVSNKGTANSGPLESESAWWTAYLEGDEDVKKKNIAERGKRECKEKQTMSVRLITEAAEQP